MTLKVYVWSWGLDVLAEFVKCLCPIFGANWEISVTCQWRIQDFPEGGREPSRGGVNTPNFPENCMKSKEFGRPGGGVRPSRPPLDPPMLAEISNVAGHGKTCILSVISKREITWGLCGDIYCSVLQIE